MRLLPGQRDGQSVGRPDVLPAGDVQVPVLVLDSFGGQSFEPGSLQERGHLVGRQQVPQQGLELPIGVVRGGLPVLQRSDPDTPSGGERDQSVGEPLCARPYASAVRHRQNSRSRRSDSASGASGETATSERRSSPTAWTKRAASHNNGTRMTSPASSFWSSPSGSRSHRSDSRSRRSASAIFAWSWSHWDRRRRLVRVLVAIGCPAFRFMPRGDPISDNRPRRAVRASSNRRSAHRDDPWLIG